MRLPKFWNHNCWGYSVPAIPQGADAIGKFILIGDHKQLPAVVLQSSEQSEVCDEALQAIGLYNLKDSLFERLYRNLSKESANRQASTSHSSSFIPHPSYDMLCRQGRMNIEVALFPNRAFTVVCWNRLVCRTSRES